jgi:hypothetical protein
MRLWTAAGSRTRAELSLLTAIPPDVGGDPLLKLDSAPILRKIRVRREGNNNYYFLGL